MTSAVLGASSTANTAPKPSNSASGAYRLLYRGALSLPDSHLLLDGLTFIARLDSPSKHNQLLQNPLALALESMRGRPSLRFMGVVKLHDGHLWWDESVGIELDVHPRATLTRTFFENVFCLNPLASTSTSVPSSPPATSDIGVKVSLGDSDGPETTQVVIFARPPSPDCSQGARVLDLIVVRLTDQPQSQNNSARLPRPDDPTPRKPPLSYGGTTKAKRELVRTKSHISVVSRQNLKRVASNVSETSLKRRKATKDDSTIAAQLGSGVRLGIGDTVSKDKEFKVPDLPPQGISNGKGKGKQTGDDDVFGSAGVITTLHADNDEKQTHDPDRTDTQIAAAEIERVNKDLIKRHTLKCLYKIKDPTTGKIDKSHPEFKDLFGWISRGVGYALRAHIKIRPVDAAHVKRLIDAHISMYLGGDGGVAVGTPGLTPRGDPPRDHYAGGVFSPRPTLGDPLYPWHFHYP